MRGSWQLTPEERQELLLEQIKREPWYAAYVQEQVAIRLKSVPALKGVAPDVVARMQQSLRDAASRHLGTVPYTVDQPSPGYANISPSHDHSQAIFLAGTGRESYASRFGDRIACVPCGGTGTDCPLCEGRGYYDD